MMDVRIRPAGYIIFAIVLIAIGYKLVYTLLWAPSSITPGETDPKAPTTVTASPATVTAPPAPAETTTGTTADTMPTGAKALSDWLILAPIPSGISIPDKVAPEHITRMLDTPYIASESQLDPKTGDTVSVAGKSLTWISSTASPLDLVTTLHQKPGDPGVSNAVAYAVTTFDSPKTTSNATLYVGSDDGVEVWLNGRQIHRNATARELKIAQDKIEHVVLNAGKNTFVFKVAQGELDWKLSALLKTE